MCTANLWAENESLKRRIEDGLIHKSWLGHISEMYSETRNGLIGRDSVYGHYFPALVPSR